MKKQRIFAAALGIFIKATPVVAVTDTWDGGGANNNLSTSQNWVDNSAPVSDVNNTDLIFAGSVRLTPTLAVVAFSSRSVTFNNTAGAFTIMSAGFPLTIGAGGITNNDTNTQTFDLSVTAAATQTISAASGALVFSGELVIPAGNNVSLAGANAVTIASFGSGTGTLTKSNAGELTIGASATPILADLLLTGGATSVSPTGITQVVGSTGSIQVGSGGAFFINENLTLSGGAQLTKAGTGTVAFPAFSGKALRIESGSDFLSDTFQSFYGGSSVTVTGAGSTLQTGPGAGLQLNGDMTLAVQAGGRVVSGASMIIGGIGGGTLAVDGAGSSFTAMATSSWGSAGSNATALFSNNATGTLTGVNISGAAGGMATVQILSGADITNTGALGIGAFANASVVGTLLLAGPGTTWQQIGSLVDIGAASAGIGTLTVNNGALFNTSGAMTINTTGTVNIDGGLLSVSGAFTSNGTLNFISGSLSLLGANNLTVGLGGLLGSNLTLAENRELTIGSTTTVDAFRTLTLNGGTLRTSSLVNDGSIHFNSGTLAITGAGGFDIGSGALGSNVTLGNGATLQVINTLTVADDAMLSLDGGALSAGALVNAGIIEANTGAASVTGAMTNQNGADLFTSRPVVIAGTLINEAGGTITLRNGTGRLSGAGTLNNSGVILGDGTINKFVTNNAGGELRAEGNQTLRVSGALLPNAGTLALQGGTLDFAAAVTNSVTGFIAGRGTLRTGGLTNIGVMAFSGGNADIHGDVINTAGARIVTSGAGSTTTFFDDVAHNGVEIFTGAGASTVIFGAATGAGPFTGTGTVYSIGDLRPGNSPASVSYGGSLVLGGGTLTMEIGGLARGSQYDSLSVASSLAADGTLALVLFGDFSPAFGDVFDLFDAASTVGAFDLLVLPGLAQNLAWDTRNLYSTGTVTVTSTLTPIQQWRLLHFGSPDNAGDGADDNDFDADGPVNLLEYALGMNPKVADVKGLPIAGTVNVAGSSYLTLTIKRPLSATDISYRFQVGAVVLPSSDGSLYTAGGDVPSNAFTTQFSRTNDGVLETITVRDNTAINSAVSRFMRLKVSDL